MVALVGLRPPESYYVTPRELSVMTRAREIELKVQWQHIRSAVWAERATYEHAMGLSEDITPEKWKQIKERHGWQK